jgi:hypothetical protein
MRVAQIISATLPGTTTFGLQYAIVFSISFSRASVATSWRFLTALEYDKSFRSLQRPESSSVDY